MAILQETTISGSVTHKEGTVTTAGTTLTLDLSTGSSFEVDMSSFTNGIDTLTVLNKTDTNHNRSFLLQVTAHYVNGVPKIFTWSEFRKRLQGMSSETTEPTNDSATYPASYQIVPSPQFRQGH